MDGRWLEMQGITSADLERNRQGRLADVQAERVRTENALRKRVLMIGLLVGVVATVALLAAFQPIERFPIVVAIAVAIDAMIFLVMRAVFRRIEAEVDRGEVTVKEAAIGKLWVMPSRNRLVMRIDRYPYSGLHMAALGAHLKEGDRVTLYTLPLSRAIVAVEPAASA